MSADFLHTSQKLSQTATITPRLQRALKLLQVPAAELRNELSVELAANPVLEEIDSSDGREESYDADFVREEAPLDRTADEFRISPDDFSVLRRMDDDRRDDYRDERASRTHTAEDAERREHFFENRESRSSFREELLGQARDAAPTPEILRALVALLGRLDDCGRLDEDPRDIALSGDIAPDDMDAALALLHGFEPAGLGARDTRECLLIQLRTSGRGSSLAARILEESYDDLLKRRLPEIARRYRTDLDTVRDAVAVIGKLDPAPGRRFAEDDNHEVAADVVVTRDRETGQLRAELTGDSVPRLRLSHAYKELLAGGRLAAKDRAYLSEKMKDGRFIIDALAHRQNTVLGVAERLLDRQADFFEQGKSGLKPLTMATVAADLGVHETTVSRAVAGKWIRTPVGMVEMRDFFSSGYTTADGGSVAAAGVKEMLAEVVHAEGADDPLSDEGIVAALEKRGVRLARRTVAKYREELGIAPRYLRRRA